MVSNQDPELLDLNTLILRCRAESRQPPSVDAGGCSSCYELLRRAVVGECAGAWDAVYAQYRRLVIHWIGPREMDVDVLVNLTFIKFWRFCPDDGFSQQFPDLKHVLGYLKQCAISARQEAQRQRQRWDQEIDGDPNPRSVPVTVVEAVALDNVAHHEWWDLIWDRLNDEHEQRLVYLTYSAGLTPMDIVERYPNAFPDIHEVRRIKERMLKRLRRDPVLQALWEERG